MAKISKKKLRVFILEMGVDDRQSTLEQIHEICEEEYEKTENETFETILELTSEFI